MEIQSDSRDNTALASKRKNGQGEGNLVPRRRMSSNARALPANKVLLKFHARHHADGYESVENRVVQARPTTETQIRIEGLKERPRKANQCEGLQRATRASFIVPVGYQTGMQGHSVI